QKYLAVTGAHDAILGMDFKLYRITDFPNPATAVTEIASGKLEPSGYTTNGNAYADIAFVKNENGTYTFYQLSTNNGLASYTTTTVLPVSLSSFTASIGANGQSKLIWSTSSESNNKGFDILRSTDGANFEVIGSVSSKALNGNSNETLLYEYVDANPANGTNYYRLKQIDLNGASSLSEIKSVNYMLSAADVSIYPNPATDFVNVKSEGARLLKVYVYDLS